MKIADMHCDTLSKLYFSRESNLKNAAGHLNIEKLCRGGYILQNFAAFMERRGIPLFQLCREMIDLYDRELASNADTLAPARSYDDILRNMQSGKISAVLTLEDAAALEGDLQRLEYLYARGVRMINLTWNFCNELGAPNQNDGPEGDTERIGLTDLGKQAIEEMERLGIIPDVSHLSDAGFWDLCSQARRPFAASHSCARALSAHRRNLTDEMLKALADRGGIVGVNFHAPFLGQKKSSYAAAAAHIRHMIRVAGENSVALGSDFDGIDDAGEFEGAGKMQRFPEALEEAGLTPRQIEKVTYQNLLAFYKDCL